MIKGKTEIVLTDINTGNEKTFFEENMVTNAISKLMNTSNIGDRACNKFFPILKWLGGIYLLGDTMEEDANKFILPYETNLIGHAGNKTDITDVYCGSYNTVESTNLDNGYKFVWDFATNQANGTIKCLSLTSIRAGNVGFGKTFEQAKNSDASFWFLEKIINMNCYDFDSKKVKYYFGDIGYNVTAINSESVKIDTYSHVLNNLKLTSSYVPKLTSTVTKQLDSKYDYIVSFMEKEKLYVGGINGRYTKANSHVYQFSTITWELEKKIDVGDLSMYYGEPDISRVRISIIDNHVFLCLSYGAATSGYVLKVSLNDANSKIFKPQKSPYYFHGVYNNGLVFDDCYFINDTFYYFKTDSLPCNILNNVDDILYAYKLAENSNDTLPSNLYINDGMMITINNLSTPIVKNNTQTMKITYEITES